MSDHFLIVEEDGDETAWYIEHPAVCPTRVVWAGDGEWCPDIMGHDCAYDYEVENAGVDAIEDGDIPTEIGRYPIEHWHEEHRGFDWVEHSTGIRILDDAEITRRRGRPQGMGS